MIDQVKLPNKLILKPVLLKLDEFENDFIEFKIVKRCQQFLKSYSQMKNQISLNQLYQIQYDRALLTEDIIGAKPKHRKTYMNRILPHQLTQEEQERLQYYQQSIQKQMPNQDIRFSKRRYENNAYHFCNIFLPSEQQYTKNIIYYFIL